MTRRELALAAFSFGGSSNPLLDVEKNGGAAAFIFAVANF